ncbi:MAG: ADP-ribosylglycohydrolase family protein [Clostridia bacterium]|nr:ADP-ribosylglycohydrolase family protein [Clostridia bacterium]
MENKRISPLKAGVIEGCLIGGAIGDAFGAPIEFYEDGYIFYKYGENGVTELQLYGGIAHISDDTQMSLFTADGLLDARARFEEPTLDEYVESIYHSYLDWLYTQDKDVGLAKGRENRPLLQVKELFARRAPGRTCISALASGRCGRLDWRLNNSKGCGGVMRVAPIGVYLAQIPSMTVCDAALLGARAAAITHSHELGYIPAAFLSAMIYELTKGKDLSAAYMRAKETTGSLFAEYSELNACLDLAERAVDLAKNQADVDDLENIRELGQGWVAEETLAIALYCAFKYPEDFEKAMIASANHSGDSDSTAAVTGNVLGTYLGLQGIPAKMVDVIELKEVILSLSKQMYM